MHKWTWLAAGFYFHEISMSQKILTAVPQRWPSKSKAKPLAGFWLFDFA
jgi:hypothetical protein